MAMKSDKRSMLVYSILLAFIVLLPFYYDALEAIPHICLFQQLFTISCPGCGMLRGLAELSSFNFSGAWHFNPASLLFAMVVFLEIFIRIKPLQKIIDINKRHAMSVQMNRAFMLLLSANWMISEISI